MSIQVTDDIWQNELLTVREVASYLRVGRVTVWRWCQEGTLSASRIGRSWRIHRHDLYCFLQKRNLLRSDPNHRDSLAGYLSQDHPLLSLGTSPTALPLPAAGDEGDDSPS